MTKLARIYPPNRARGYFAHNYLFPNSGYPKFEHHRGWYEVDDKMAERMATVRNNPQDPHSRPVFQIVSKDEAIAMEEREVEKAAEATAPIPMPNKLKAKPEVEEDWPEDMGLSDDELFGDLDDGSDEPEDEPAVRSHDLTSAEVSKGETIKAEPKATKKKAPAKKKVSRKKTTKKKPTVSKKTTRA